MAAEVLIGQGAKVDVYDSMPSLGRKFLMAGTGGLNLTHSEPFEKFISRYGKRKNEVKKWLMNFTPDDLREWARGLGVETFVGTSGRVFPVGMKTSPLLRGWLKRLTDSGVDFHLQHRWVGEICPAGFLLDSESSSPTYGTVEVKFETPEGEKSVRADAAVLALGGGSWARLGSDGAWVQWLDKAGAEVKPLKPSNCGFDVAWSPHFRERFDGQPLKSVVLSFGEFCQQGEFIVTKDGVQGSLIYAASALLRDEIEANGVANITLDMSPDRSEEWLIEKLSKPRGSRSMSSHIEKTIGLKGVKMGLLHEFMPKEDFASPERIAYFRQADAHSVGRAASAGRSHQQRGRCDLRVAGRKFDAALDAGDFLRGRNVRLGSAHGRIFADRVFCQRSRGGGRGVKNGGVTTLDNHHTKKGRCNSWTIKSRFRN